MSCTKTICFTFLPVGNYSLIVYYLMFNVYFFLSFEPNIYFFLFCLIYGQFVLVRFGLEKIVKKQDIFSFRIFSRILLDLVQDD